MLQAQEARESATELDKWNDVAAFSEERPAQPSSPNNSVFPVYEPGSPEAAVAKSKLLRVLTRFTRTGKQGRLSSDDVRRYGALPAEDRAALDEEFGELWAKNLKACPFDKLELAALKELRVMRPGELIASKEIKNLGPHTADRLEARGFIEKRHSADETNRREGYVLTVAGSQAAKDAYE